MDPGIQTPFSIYSSDGIVVDIGTDQDKLRLEQLRLCKDRLLSCQYATLPQRGTLPLPPPTPTEPAALPPLLLLVLQVPPTRLWQTSSFALCAKRRRCLCRSIHKTQWLHNNLVKELHSCTAHYLSLSAEVIVMPRMEVSQMLKKKRGNLNAHTKCQLKSWSHCAFLNCLAVNCQDIALDPRKAHSCPMVLLVQPEAYTSKTCGRCGALHHNSGSNKVFRCPSCPYTADRDHNGTYNMIIKAI